jgi:hypothetical protein
VPTDETLGDYGTGSTYSAFWIDDRAAPVALLFRAPRPRCRAWGSYSAGVTVGPKDPRVDFLFLAREVGLAFPGGRLFNVRDLGLHDIYRVFD